MRGTVARNDPTPERDLDQTTGVKCAYGLCECVVEPGDKYCSNYCEDAAREREVEIQCDCKHPSCALN